MDVTYLQSLLNLLSLKRVILLTEHGQDAFDRLSDQYKASLETETSESELSMDSEQELASTDEEKAKKVEKIAKEKICKGKTSVNVTSLFNLLNQTYRFMLFKLISSNGGDDAAFNEVSIKDVLEEFIYETNTNQEESLDLKEFDLRGFKLKNIYHFWKLIVQIYMDKKNL